MAKTADFIAIGGGIAGVSVAYELVPHGSVIVLEQESATGYHSTGRSAAVMSENYGPRLWSRLVTATRGFLENPPEGFTGLPLVTDRTALFLAQAHEVEQLQAQYNDLITRGARVELIAADDALRYCEVLRTDKYATAMYEPDCKDVDTNELMMGYQRGIRAAGGSIVTGGRVTAIRRNAAGWQVDTTAGQFQGGIIVNAAGGWVQQVADMAGLGYRNVVPFRRTAVTFDAPAGSNLHRWPMTFDVAETFYFKPEVGKVMVSPVDMAQSEPCDAQADEMEVAIAIDRIETFTTMTVKRISHKWGGLRTFAPDHEPVIGADPQDVGFIWLAGQGGNGVMASAASARLAASLAVGDGIPADIAALGITIDAISPGRDCVINRTADDVQVGSVEDILAAD
jgi:D-arginine dehydrogenase